MFRLPMLLLTVPKNEKMKRYQLAAESRQGRNRQRNIRENLVANHALYRKI